MRGESIKHAGVVAGALVVVMATAASAVTAVTAVKDPSRMILRQADVASSGTYEADDNLDEYLETPLKAAGLSGRVATYFGATFSEQKGFVKVSGIVLTVASPAEARRVFAITKQARDRFGKRIGSTWTTVSLPSYGDQQRALIDPPGNEGIAVAELIVRKRTAVWLLHVTLERRPKPPVTELVADLKRFASKQKARVGAG
jgi:hypothetical protein